MEKKRILFLRPNSAIGRCPPPLGLLYLASFIRHNESEYEIKIYDARCRDSSEEETRAVILAYEPHVLGLTGMHPEAPALHALARFTRERIPGCQIVLGGPYASSDTERAARDVNVDAVAVGEGEETFRELLDYFRGVRPREKIDGIAYREGVRVVQTRPRAGIQNLDDIPFPAWDLINLDDYFFGKKLPLENPFQVYRRAVPLLSSRGCPYRCIYCHNIFGNKFRARSPENILAELTLLKDTYGIQEIEFLDDSFNIDYGRVMGICDHLIRCGMNLKICFSNGIRLDRVDGPLLDRMKAAGTYRINYGIESVNERIQKVVRKGLAVSRISEAIRLTVKRGILCGGFFMIGFPTETEEEVQETLDFAVKSQLHTAVFAIATPYPGTKMFEQAQQAGYNVDVEFGTVFAPTVNMSSVPDERLSALRLQAYRRFYFSARRAWRIFRAAPAKRPLVGNFWEVVRVALFRKSLY